MVTPIDCYAVMGNPITHSKSPIIHTAFAKITNQQLHYKAIEVEPLHFETAVSDFFRVGGKGLSITAPFKERAAALAQIKTERAQKAGAVNTLWLNDAGYISGDNTDGLGFIRDLKKNNNLSLTGARVLVLGAGGAVRGIVSPLLHEQPKDIVIANRTMTKAEALIELLQLEHDMPKNTTVSACSFASLEGAFDLIINGTSISLQGEKLNIPTQIVSSYTVSYDMMYGAEETLFNQWAKQASARTCLDGLGMLVEQAAEQFLIWRGVQPETLPILIMLRKNISLK